jgi:hypothetical protein
MADANGMQRPDALDFPAAASCPAPSSRCGIVSAQTSALIGANVNFATATSGAG